jgi:hypothetical protein
MSPEEKDKKIEKLETESWSQLAVTFSELSG